jgi:hypothetical protein
MRAVHAILPILLATTPLSAQEELGLKLRRQFENCVYASVGTQWVASTNLNANIAAEQAFVECQTEETAIYSALALLGIGQAQAAATVTSLRLNLKRQVREIVADPAGYVKRNQQTR